MLKSPLRVLWMPYQPDDVVPSVVEAAARINAQPGWEICGEGLGRLGIGEDFIYAAQMALAGLSDTTRDSAALTPLMELMDAENLFAVVWYMRGDSAGQAAVEVFSPCDQPMSSRLSAPITEALQTETR